MTREDKERKTPPALPKTRRRVLLVDDHPIVRQGLMQLINREPDLEVCGEADTEAAAMSQLEQLRPDVIVADLTLESGSGIELIRRVRQDHPHLPILVLSMHDEQFYVEMAIRAGAWGYLTKQEASSKILLALRKLLDGQVYLGEHLSHSLLQSLVARKGEEQTSLVSRLSGREMQVFLLIGAGLNMPEIADRLNLSVKTVETYQSKIREKLELKDVRKVIQYAINWVLTH